MNILVEIARFRKFLNKEIARFRNFLKISR